MPRLIHPKKVSGIWVDVFDKAFDTPLAPLHRDVLNVVCQGEIEGTSVPVWGPIVPPADALQGL